MAVRISRLHRPVAYIDRICRRHSGTLDDFDARLRQIPHHKEGKGIDLHSKDH